MAKASPEDRRLLRIGDLASRAGATTRMLRHYENQGLVEAERSSTGQRLFEPAVVEQVRHIRMLLEAGLPTLAIRELLDCIQDDRQLEPCAVPLLLDHLRAYDGRIARLVSIRDTLQGLIDSSTPGP